MDFDSPSAAQKAVTALKSSGVQAQMAKVSQLTTAHCQLSLLVIALDLSFVENYQTKEPELPP